MSEKGIEILRTREKNPSRLSPSNHITFVRQLDNPTAQLSASQGHDEGSKQ